MAPPSPDSAPSVVVEMAEWEQVGPVQEPRLSNLTLAGDASAETLAEALRQRVDIREGYRGLEITTTSFVGRVAVGPLQIAIRPKLAAGPLAPLLRYAYGLRDLRTSDAIETPTVKYGLQDLLVTLLATEMEELLYRGLVRRYAPLSNVLESPRGRIDMPGMVRRGGVREARLPCLYVERRVDWHLNQVLCAGLAAALPWTTDFDLRRRVQRLLARFSDIAHMSCLSIRDLDEAERSLTRLTAAAAPALTLIRLLLNAMGVAFEAKGQEAPTPGFLFDMNVFFQRLLSRFLQEYLVGRHIADERAIRGLFAYAPNANPRHRSPPQPRPDYALLQGHNLLGFLDAKYRDVWERGYPAEWPYQLSIYALASPEQVSVLLYASANTEARDERVDVRPPLPGSKRIAGSVILRPVLLLRLAALLDPDRANGHAAERRRLAEELVSFQVDASPIPNRIMAASSLEAVRSLHAQPASKRPP